MAENKVLQHPKTNSTYAREKAGSRLDRYSVRDIAIRLFFTCWLIYALHFATNTVREIYPALSLGDHLSFDVSEYLGLHPDIFEMPGRGAFINNNPGASIMGAVPYALARPVIDRIVASIQHERQVSGAPAPVYKTIYPMSREFYQQAYERGLDVKFGLAAGVMQAFLMAPISALSVVVMFYILLSLVGSVRKALLLAVLYAFATPVFYRTAQLNHNLLISHCALFAFALLWRPWDKSSQQKRPHYLLAGLLTGWSLVLDYSGLIVILVVGLYALVRWSSQPAETRRWSDLIRFSAGVAVCIAILMGYQWMAFGNPIYPAQSYMPPTQYTSYGYRGMEWPQLDLLWLLSFGMRYGLFTSAPLLALALYIPGWIRRKDRLVGNLETWFIVVFTAAFFLFTAANQFARLQFNSGVRHVVPVTPFLFLLAANVLIRMPTWLAVPVGVLSTYWSWCLAMYRDVEKGLGVFESLIHISTSGPRLPWLTTLHLLGLVPSWFTALPIFLIGGIAIFLIWYINIPRLAQAWPFVMLDRSTPRM
jgi:hypothetical protein